MKMLKHVRHQAVLACAAVAVLCSVGCSDYRSVAPPSAEPGSEEPNAKPGGEEAAPGTVEPGATAEPTDSV